MATKRTGKFHGIPFKLKASQLNQGDFFIVNDKGYIFLGEWSSMIHKEYRCLRLEDTHILTLDHDTNVIVSPMVEILFTRV